MINISILFRLNSLMKLNSVAFSLGSNLGDKRKNLDNALSLLNDRVLFELHRSTFYSSKALDFPNATHDFINIAVIGKTYFPPGELLNQCQEIEEKMGRPKNHAFREDRAIDIDILLYNHDTVNTSKLSIPHPEMTHRDFVLIPLSEIASAWIIPPSGNTVAYFCSKIKNLEIEP